MSLQENRCENKLVVLEMYRKKIKNQKRDFDEIYELLDKRTEEMQEEIMKIIGDIKLLLAKKKYVELEQYVNTEYQILKTDMYISENKSMLQAGKHE